jgi:hypothetical protein
MRGFLLALQRLFSQSDYYLLLTSQLTVGNRRNNKFKEPVQGQCGIRVTL